MQIGRRDSPQRRRLLEPAQVRKAERWSRVLDGTTVQALDSVQATTSATQVRALLAVKASGGCSNAELAAVLAIFSLLGVQVDRSVDGGGSSD